MKTYLLQCQTRMICAIGVLAWTLGGMVPFTLAADPPTASPTVEEQKGDAGKVEERGIQRPMPGVMAPGIKSPGGKFSALTKAECTSLGCKAVDDNTCPEVGLIRQRCHCAGSSKGVCIDEVK